MFFFHGFLGTDCLTHRSEAKGGLAHTFGLLSIPLLDDTGKASVAVRVLCCMIRF